MDDKFFLLMVDKFNSSDITEMDFNDGNMRLLLRKEGAFKQLTPATGENTVPVIPNVPPVPAPPIQNSSVHLGITAQSSGNDSSGGASGVGKTSGEKIKSPIVATFYSSPSPDAPAFVKPGTKIKIGQTLCILEAMKMMNHLEAEFDCEIIEVLVNSGSLVEYGQELFTVKRN